MVSVNEAVVCGKNDCIIISGPRDQKPFINSPTKSRQRMRRGCQLNSLEEWRSWAHHRSGISSREGIEKRGKKEGAE